MADHHQRRKTELEEVAVGDAVKKTKNHCMREGAMRVQGVVWHIQEGLEKPWLKAIMCQED
ncbi:hypothetical protein CTI12_AA620780 [Artemisia annua]|uniref:Uncharacterized protein n=1 Tax=Artemisia annua TaxID=35608 RepID=A0A2U1KC88_ARTAN|nr:hypothetical protein CTI12_AA620780 [Artemisia annua]